MPSKKDEPLIMKARIPHFSSESYHHADEPSMLPWSPKKHWMILVRQ